MERSSSPSSSKPPLHNFSLPYLRWGNQRLLRCVKVDSPSSLSSPHCEANNNGGGGVGGGAHRGHHHLSSVYSPRPCPTTREKAPGNLFTSPAPASPPLPLPLPLPPPDVANGDPTSTRPPWNLRTRRAACKAPSPLRVALEGGGGVVAHHHLEGGSLRREREKEKEVVGNGGVVKFSVSLTREEIEEDFMEMGRNRPPRRPKKRPRVVQKYLDSIFPGLWLSEITPDSYKVAEVVES